VLLWPVQLTQGVVRRWGGFIGASVGRSSVDISESEIDAAIVAEGVASSVTSADDSDTGWKVFLGYRANKNFAFEAGYVDLGEATIVTTTTGPDAIFGGRAEVNGYFGDVLGIMPVDPSLDLFLKAGIYRWQMEWDVAAATGGSVFLASGKENGTNIKLGLGASYRIGDSISIRAEYERYRDVGDKDVTGKDDVDFFSVGISTAF